MVFGAALLLFAVFALLQGFGDPTVPAGAIAVIEDTPEGTVEITRAELDHAIVLGAAAQGLDPPEPGTPLHEDLKAAAVDELIKSVWVPGQAEELGFEMTERELEAEIERIKEEEAESEAEFREILELSGYTLADFEKSIRRGSLNEDTESWLAERVPVPSEEEIEDYYSAFVDAEKAIAVPQPGERYVRLVVNKDRAEVEQALRRLERDRYALEGWDRVVKQLSEDPSRKEDGYRNFSEEDLDDSLTAAVFAAGDAGLSGLVKTDKGFAVFEVLSTTEPSDGLNYRSLQAMKGDIKRSLKSQIRNELVSDFGYDYIDKWTARTFCAPGYVVEACANFESDGHPDEAPAACYEAEPKGGRPEACPAVVTLTKVVSPGAVSLLVLGGERRPQGPQPSPRVAKEEAAKQSSEDSTFTTP